MIDTIFEHDKELFLFLNGKNVNWLDSIMLVFSSYALWWTVFAIFGVLIWIYPKRGKLASVLFYIGAVLFSTLFTNGLKLIVQRPRPIHERAWDGMIHNIEKYSDSFSFFSSHAATTFCIAVFTIFFFKGKRYIGYIALLWALCVSYSRIYVGKHYPLDVGVGILFGSFVGYVGYMLLTRYLKRDTLRP